MKKNSKIITNEAREPDISKTCPVTVLLIEDQLADVQKVRDLLLGEENIVVYQCNTEQEAIQIAYKVHPTVVLQHLGTLDKNSLSLLRDFQSKPELREIPFILFSTQEQPSIQGEAFTLGAADYIVKVDKIELLARLRHHTEIYRRLFESNDVYQKLLESQQVLKADLLNAAAYVTSLLPLPLQGDVEASWRFIPSAQLGGDAFGYYWLDADHFAFYLLDVSGHGVGAALLSITIANIIRSQALVNTDFKDPSQVLYSLNEMFPMDKHNNMFFTIWYGVYNKKTRLMKYSSGGHPPALLYNLGPWKTMNPMILRTNGLIIGALPNTPYSNENCQVPFNNRLLLFSDGIFEIRNAKNEMITFTDLTKILDHYVNTSHHDLDRVVHAAQDLQGGTTSFRDDFSILEFTLH